MYIRKPSTADIFKPVLNKLYKNVKYLNLEPILRTLLNHDGKYRKEANFLISSNFF